MYRKDMTANTKIFRHFSQCTFEVYILNQYQYQPKKLTYFKRWNAKLSGNTRNTHTIPIAKQLLRFLKWTTEIYFMPDNFIKNTHKIQTLLVEVMPNGRPASITIHQSQCLMLITSTITVLCKRNIHSYIGNMSRIGVKMKSSFASAMKTCKLITTPKVF